MWVRIYQASNYITRRYDLNIGVYGLIQSNGFNLKIETGLYENRNHYVCKVELNNINDIERLFENIKKIKGCLLLYEGIIVSHIDKDIEYNVECGFELIIYDDYYI